MGKEVRCCGQKTVATWEEPWSLANTESKSRKIREVEES